MNNQQQTPMQEAMSVVSIAAILAGLLSFFGASNNVPIVSPALFWIAQQTYKYVPELSGLHQPQIPMLVSSAVVAALVWCIGMAFAGQLAQFFTVGQMASIERQTAKLQQARAKVQKARRARSSFEVR